ncbi:MAG: CopG family transcriptional regulator [Alphaproteobacteria bacterium]
MRTIVDIPDEDVKILDSIGQKENLSRAELVRRAVAQYLESEKEKSNAAIGKYFGFLKDVPEAFDGLDGVEYQRKIRSEWDERDKMYSKWAMQDPAGSNFRHKKDNEK